MDYFVNTFWRRLPRFVAALLLLTGINLISGANTMIHAINNVENVPTKSTNDSLKTIMEKMPREINGWTINGNPKFHTPETLYQYINGGAELYISYDFKSSLSMKYFNGPRENNSGELTVDIFDMGGPFNAYGVFSHSRESLDLSIGEGVESEYASGLLTFWKGRFYVSILTYPETPEKKQTILALGRHIADLITGKNHKPTLISALPTNQLIPNSIRYFRHYIWLNSHYYIADQDILHINKNTEAVLASYREEQDNNERYFVLVVSYPGTTGAEAAHRSFLQNYLPGAVNGIEKLEDGRWSGCRRENNRVTVVFNAATATTVERILKKEQ